MTTFPLHVSADWERPAIPTSGGAATLMIRIVAPAAPVDSHRAGVDLAFVIDRSGSMAGQPLELAKQAVSRAVALLDARDRAALVVYDDDIDLLHPLSAVDSHTRAAFRQQLLRVDARGTTNLCDGWLTGCRELARHDNSAGTAVRIQRAILLTDGLANQGETDPGAIWHHATQLRLRGVSTTALGLGSQFDEALLSGMAEAGGGNFAYLKNASQLTATFERELGRLIATASTNINVRLRLPDGLRGELLSRFPVERTGHQFDVALDDLVAGDEVVLIFEITGRALPSITEFPIELSVRSTDSSIGTRRTVTIPVRPLAMVEEAHFATMPLLEEVTSQAAIQRAAANQRRAMELDRAGRYAESRALHNAALDLLDAAPLDDADMHLRDEARVYASYNVNAAFSEDARKQAAADAFHRTRRRKRSEA